MNDVDIRAVLLQAGFPPALVEYRYRQDPIPAAVAAYYRRLLDYLAREVNPEHEHRASGIVLTGPVHCCKSSMAVRLGWKYVQSGHKVAWLDPWSLEAEMAADYQRYSDRYTQADVLVIDDVSAGGRANNAIVNIINRRVQGRGTTIITANVPLQHIAAVLVGDGVGADRLNIRLAEMVTCGLYLDLSSIPSQRVPHA